MGDQAGAQLDSLQAAVPDWSPTPQVHTVHSSAKLTETRLCILMAPAGLVENRRSGWSGGGFVQER